MSKLLTIVIPCYNVEQYLAGCLDSILLPEYNGVLEVLAINDGSRDGTLALAREYEKRFPDILRVVDKPNGGWGTVINLAIKEARGRYFKILDSDDWFDKAAFAELMARLKECEADIFVSNFTEHYTDKTIAGKSYPESLCGNTLSLDKFIEEEPKFTLFPMTNITVKVDIIKQGNVILPDRYYGDICFFIYVHALSNSVYVTNLNVYQYRKFVDGQSTSVAGYIRNFRDYIEVNRRLVSFFANTPLTKYKKLIIKSNLIRNIGFTYKLLMSREYCGNLEESKDILLDFNKFLKNNSVELYRASNRITNKKVPFILIWRLFNINLYKLR